MVVFIHYFKLEPVWYHENFSVLEITAVGDDGEAVLLYSSLDVHTTLVTIIVVITAKNTFISWCKPSQAVIVQQRKNLCINDGSGVHHGICILKKLPALEAAVAAANKHRSKVFLLGFGWLVVEVFAVQFILGSELGESTLSSGRSLVNALNTFTAIFVWCTAIPVVLLGVRSSVIIQLLKCPIVYYYMFCSVGSQALFMFIFSESHDLPWFFVQAAILVLCGSVPFIDAQPPDIRLLYCRICIWVLAATAIVRYVLLKVIQAPHVKQYHNANTQIDGFIVLSWYNYCTDW